MCGVGSVEKEALLQVSGERTPASNAGTMIVVRREDGVTTYTCPRSDESLEAAQERITSSGAKVLAAGVSAETAQEICKRNSILRLLEAASKAGDSPMHIENVRNAALSGAVEF